MTNQREVYLVIYDEVLECTCGRNSWNKTIRAAYSDWKEAQAHVDGTPKKLGRIVSVHTLNVFSKYE